MDLRSIGEPRTLTSAEVQFLPDYTDALRAYGSDLASVKAPMELQIAHGTYLTDLSTLSNLYEQFLAAVKADDASGWVDTVAAITKFEDDVEQPMTAAQPTLEEALGFSL